MIRALLLLPVLVLATAGCGRGGDAGGSDGRANVPRTVGADETALGEEREKSVAGSESAITFDLEGVSEEGLVGPPDGLRAVAYEFCVPEDEEAIAEVLEIDPSLAFHPGSPGRIGCGEGEVLCIGSTHQPGWRAVLTALADLEYVARIDRSFAE